MKVTCYGTRGSLPVAGAKFAKYGGRTTCLRVESECLPANHWLAVDAGSGFLPFGLDALKAGAEAITTLFTHYHWDHTQGLPLTPVTFIKSIRMNCFGPIENDIGPEEMLRASMQPPFFPVRYNTVASHFHCQDIQNPASQVIVFHPKGGTLLIDVDRLEQAEAKPSRQIRIGDGNYSIDECLVVRMLYTNHPERTISYRFEERPTGKIFVLYTDHENTDINGLPGDMARHLKDADLLIADCQYTRDMYNSRTAGFGHGTPDYCVTIAAKVKIKKLGLTHHDISATDDKVDQILETAQHFAAEQYENFDGQIFTCADDQVIEI